MLPPSTSDGALNERMRPGHVRNRFDFLNAQYPQIGLPLVMSYTFKIGIRTAQGAELAGDRYTKGKKDA